MNRQHVILSSTLLLLGMAPAVCGAQAEYELDTSGYHVTAIYGYVSKGYSAVVIKPDGTSDRVRAGDRIDDLVVDEVAAKWIVLSTGEGEPGKRVVLDGLDPVSGGQAPPAAGSRVPAQSGASGPGMPLAAGSDGGSSTSVGGAPLTDAGTGEGEVSEAPEVPTLPESRTLPQLADQLRTELDPVESFHRPVEDLDQVLGQALGLPAEAKVVELASGPPRSFRDGMRSVMRAARSDKIVRLTIETSGRRQRVTIFPGADGSPAEIRLSDMEGAGNQTPAAGNQMAPAPSDAAPSGLEAGSSR